MQTNSGDQCFFASDDYGKKERIASAGSLPL